MKTYAFLTADSWRLEVSAKNARLAHRKALVEAKKKGKKLTKTYAEEDEEGFASQVSWRKLR